MNNPDFKLAFDYDKFVLTENRMFVGKGFSIYGMFKLNIINEMPSTLAYLIESCKLWHGRLGNVHYNNVKHMAKLRLFNNRANTYNEKCIV